MYIYIYSIIHTYIYIYVLYLTLLWKIHAISVKLMISNDLFSSPLKLQGRRCAHNLQVHSRIHNLGVYKKNRTTSVEALQKAIPTQIQGLQKEPRFLIQPLDPPWSLLLLAWLRNTQLFVVDQNHLPFQWHLLFVPGHNLQPWGGPSNSIQNHQNYPSTKRRWDLTPRSTRTPFATNSYAQHLFPETNYLEYAFCTGLKAQLFVMEISKWIFFQCFATSREPGQRHRPTSPPGTKSQGPAG